MIGLPYDEKNYDNILSRFHPIPERYGQTDGQTDGQNSYINIACQNVPARSHGCDDRWCRQIVQQNIGAFGCCRDRLVTLTSVWTTRSFCRPSCPPESCTYTAFMSTMQEKTQSLVTWKFSKIPIIPALFGNRNQLQKSLAKTIHILTDYIWKLCACHRPKQSHAAICCELN